MHRSFCVFIFYLFFLNGAEKWEDVSHYGEWVQSHESKPFLLSAQALYSTSSRELGATGTKKGGEERKGEVSRSAGDVTAFVQGAKMEAFVCSHMHSMWLLVSGRSIRDMYRHYKGGGLPSELHMPSVKCPILYTFSRENAVCMCVCA